MLFRSVGDASLMPKIQMKTPIYVLLRRCRGRANGRARAGIAPSARSVPATNSLPEPRHRSRMKPGVLGAEGAVGMQRRSPKISCVRRQTKIEMTVAGLGEVETWKSFQASQDGATSTCLGAFTWNSASRRETTTDGRRMTTKNTMSRRILQNEIHSQMNQQGEVNDRRGERC